MTRDDFEEWLESPSTREFLKVLARYSAFAKSRWQDWIWNQGYLRPEEQAALSRLRARAELAAEIAEIDFESYEEFNEPEQERHLAD